jgi:hypothetical protein
MFARPFWLNRLQEIWRAVPIAWLAGVRRSGKTTIAQSLSGEQTLYVNCDLPEAEDAAKNPTLFYKGCDKPIVIFDEVHHLKDPKDDAVPPRRLIEFDVLSGYECLSAGWPYTWMGRLSILVPGCGGTASCVTGFGRGCCIGMWSS